MTEEWEGINWTQILAAAQTAILVAGGVAWLVSGNGDTRQAQHDVVALTAQIRDLGLKIEELQKNLATIVQLGVRMDQGEHEITDLYHRSDDINHAVSAANLLAVQVRSDLNALMRAEQDRQGQGRR